MTQGRITVLAVTLALAVSGIATTPARADPDSFRIITVQSLADSRTWGMDRGVYRYPDRDRFHQQRYTAPGDRDQGAPQRYTAPRDRDVQVQRPRYRKLFDWSGRNPDLWRR